MQDYFNKNKYKKNDKEKETEECVVFDSDNNWEWLVGLALVSGIFSGDSFGKKDTNDRLTKLETKVEILEKIILG